MGSLDPLPAGFEIRFRSLNFQATGNEYLMRITNCAEFHLWRFSPLLLPTRPSARVGGCCGPFGTPTPTALRPALPLGANGTTSGCARHLTTQRTC
jgi:hypothetical protein